MPRSPVALEVPPLSRLGQVESPSEPRHAKRQAVVIIHGLGDQLPMETLRRFVNAVVTPTQADGRPFYSKPDRISDTLELRRLAVNNTGKDPQHFDHPTDFYELYWQHLMTGTTFAHLQAWLRKLLLHWPGNVPRRLRPAWRLTWALIILPIVSLSVYAVCVGRLPVVEGIGAVVLLYVGRHLIRPWLEDLALKYIGDAARYLSPFPENVGIRRAIRSAGLDLLRGLHVDPLRRYERIIVVGHSLGSVIAYDVLTYLWQEMHSKVERSPQKHGKPELEEIHHRSESKSPPSLTDQSALKELTDWVKQMPQEPPATKSAQLELNSQYRLHQRALWNEYRALWDKHSDKYRDEGLEFRFPWRITDLVTLGSPLTYADFLLAKNLGEFEEAKKQREFPTCPPKLEDLRDDEYEPGDRGLLTRIHPREAPKLCLRILHHGALFACTRWTNLYFQGDVVGGPLAYVPDPCNPKERVELFGLGVQDVKVHGRSEHRWVSHVKYWAKEEKSAVKELRTALDLGDKAQKPMTRASKPN
jgi:hypothetical protein